MILVYPMLVSGTVSPNVIPGIVKAVERYLLIYGLDDVLKRANTVLGTVDKFVKVSMNRLVLDEQGAGTKTGAQVQVSLGSKEKEGKKETSYNIFNPSFTSISLEPTWLSVSTPKQGLQVIGIKVIPFPVKTNTTLVQALLNDTKSSVGKKITSQFSRAVIRALFRILRKLHIPGIHGRVITGDPKIDVVWAATMYKHHIFTCFSKVEIEEVEQIFSSPQIVNGLHKMGWTSFVITDDVKKTATFCMEEFGGVCSEIPYSYLFSSLSSSTGKTFEDLESLQKSSGPFFRMKTSKTKVFKECLSRKEPLQEGILDIASKFSTEKLIGFIQKADDALVSGDPKHVLSKFSMIPIVSMDKIHGFFSKISNKFSDTYEFSRTVVQNSTNLDPKRSSYIATILTAGSILESPEDPKADIKEKLKMFVSTYRASKLSNSFSDSIKVLISASLAAIGAKLVVDIPKLKTLRDYFFKLISVIKKNPKASAAIIIILFIIFLLYISADA